MSEPFLSLSGKDRRYALDQTAARLGQFVYILEKDIWVVWSLQTLFESAWSEHLVFKGGTSLSKAYDIIKRFSEDVDITYDIRAIAPDLVGDQDEALPSTRSKANKWARKIRHRLAEWVSGEVQPYLQGAITEQRLPAKVRAEGEKIFIDYEVVSASGSDYVIPTVTLEFSARSTGEPATPRNVKCDADVGLVGGVVFPSAKPLVMYPGRTFWEKATAIHVFCFQQRLRGERFARHWYDLARLDDVGIADAALRDRALLDSVVRNKTMFFRMRAADGEYIDYGDVLDGKLQLVPTGDARLNLEADYIRMIQNNLMLEEAETFDALLDRCAEIERCINQAMLK
ncbi:MAG: nucleotidyl transferase AbiEii/AbiGii toxin family protein [Gammaproteobacteria bacterium AqS3]|nr:nucleotidyl transferase AbiEii/AbiGii toxin family protein [Gammaproteobacteria bacterium AqS3]